MISPIYRIINSVMFVLWTPGFPYIQWDFFRNLQTNVFKTSLGAFSKVGWRIGGLNVSTL